MFLGIFWGRNSGEGHLDYAPVHGLRVAVRYISRNRTVWLKGHFHFVKKQSENKGEERLLQRERLGEAD